MAAAAQEVLEYQEAFSAVVEKARGEGIPFSRIRSIIEGYGSKEGLAVSPELAQLAKTAAREREEAMQALAEDESENAIAKTPAALEKKLARIEVREFKKRQELEAQNARIIAFNKISSKKKEDKKDEGFFSKLGGAFLGLALVSKLSKTFGAASAHPSARATELVGVSKFAKSAASDVAAGLGAQTDDFKSPTTGSP